VAGLHAALKARMQSVVARYWHLETKTEDSPRAPEVVDGWLPPKTGDQDDRFPFVILRPRRGEDSPQAGDENARASIDIVVGTYSDSNDGWLDVLVLIDAIRDDLGTAPAIEGTAYEHVGPLSWDIPEQQTRPQWLGVITTNWNLPRPQRAEARNARDLRFVQED
jgi:hypothetical protein